MIRLKNRKVLARQKRSSRYIVKEWTGRLAGIPAFIIGNSPCLDDEPVKILEEYFTIGVNRAFYSIDPTILLWQDIGLWNTEHRRLHNLQCLKVCRDISDPRHIYYNFYLRGGPFRFENKTHILNGRGSTGPLAIQFAVALGCKPVVLLGMDCQTRDGKTDFYGNNPHWKPTTPSNCKRGLEFIRDNCPVKIINCSSVGIFDSKVSLKDVVSSFDKKFAMGRQKYISKLVHNKKK